MISQAVILCGGIGSRLGALTADTPKPLLHVGDGPFLELLLFELGRHGFRNILLLAGFRAEQVADFAAASPSRAYFGLNIRIVTEPEPAGTGGALHLARDGLSEQFLMLNGDSWFDVNVLDLTQLLADAPTAAGAVALRRLPDASRYGVIDFAGTRITGFRDRPARPGPGIVNGGVYAFRRRIVDRLSANCSLERDVLPTLAGEGAVLGRLYDGYFVDIGIPVDLADARSDIPRRRRRGAAFVTEGVLLSRDDPAGSPAAYRWREGAREGIRLLNDRGLFVFTAASPGLPLDAASVAADLAPLGAHIDDIRSGVQGRLIDDLMKFWPVDRDTSLLIGESEDELLVARPSGLPERLFAHGNFAELVSIFLSDTRFNPS